MCRVGTRGIQTAGSGRVLRGWGRGAAEPRSRGADGLVAPRAPDVLGPSVSTPARQRCAGPGTLATVGRARQLRWGVGARSSFPTPNSADAPSPSSGLVCLRPAQRPRAALPLLTQHRGRSVGYKSLSGVKESWARARLDLSCRPPGRDLPSSP